MPDGLRAIQTHPGGHTPDGAPLADISPDLVEGPAAIPGAIRASHETRLDLYTQKNASFTALHHEGFCQVEKLPQPTPSPLPHDKKKIK